jgi:ABC-type glycerol-3-phosphate transport system substrate-binding protein
MKKIAHGSWDAAVIVALRPSFRHRTSSAREEASTMHEGRNASGRRRVTVRAGVLVVVLVATAWLAATAMGGSASKTISVAIVANPQMQDIASLTPSLFTAKTGIKVKYTILDEGKLREVTTRDVGSGGKSFDAVMIGMYETPQFGTACLLYNLTLPTTPYV